VIAIATLREGIEAALLGATQRVASASARC
jgi:hypothetical protein